MEAVAATATWYNVAYLITGILFILGLKYMSSPKTARFGNRLSMAGMVIALIATFAQGVVQWPVIIGGLVVGAAVGIYFGRAVKMTAMPQMVAIFNGCGGGAASLVAMGELMKTLSASNGAPLPYDFTITTMLIVILRILFILGCMSPETARFGNASDGRHGRRARSPRSRRRRAVARDHRRLVVGAASASTPAARQDDRDAADGRDLQRLRRRRRRSSRWASS